MHARLALSFVDIMHGKFYTDTKFKSETEVFLPCIPTHCLNGALLQEDSAHVAL